MSSAYTHITPKSPLTLRGDFGKPHLKIRGGWGVIFVFLLFFLLLLPTTASASTLSKAPNNLGLVGYWSFSEGSGTKVTDSSGKGNNGTITGATWTSGKLGKALSFNGSNNLVSTSLQIPTSGAYTISMWIKKSQSYSGNHILWMQNVGGDIVLYYNGSSLYFGYENVFDATDTVVGWNYNLDTNWHHILLVENYTGDVDGNKFYVDGVQITSTESGPASFSPSSSNFYIGNRIDADVAWNGSIDEVRVYNRALSATEVAKLYKSGSVKMKIPVNSTIARVQKNSEYPSDGSLAFISGNTAGNFIVVGFNSGDNSGGSFDPTISDTQGNTYQSLPVFINDF